MLARIFSPLRGENIASSCLCQLWTTDMPSKCARRRDSHVITPVPLSQKASVYQIFELKVDFFPNRTFLLVMGLFYMILLCFELSPCMYIVYFTVLTDIK